MNIFHFPISFAMVYVLSLSAIVSFADQISTIEQMRFDRKRIQFERRYSKNIHLEACLNDYRLVENASSNAFRRWTYELLSNTNSRIVHVPNTNSFKIVAEAWIDPSKTYNNERFAKNLELVKNRGYNSVLTRFDDSTDMDAHMRMIETIKSNGLMVVSTYTAPDYRIPRWNPYALDVDLFKSRLSRVAERSDGWFLTWRSMTTHVRAMPREFFNWLSYNVRQGNPNIPIYGEVFTGRLDPIMRMGVGIVKVDGMNGFVVMALGFYGISNIKDGIKMHYPSKVGKEFETSEKICQVVGYYPYYASKFNRHLSLEQEIEYKTLVEEKFHEVGCMTVTYVHDGCDDHQTQEYGTNDNIAYLDLIK